ncbi:MAG: hypothetical protein WDN66_05320 [Candidatus Saccharibacteria bacterium]
MKTKSKFPTVIYPLTLTAVVAILAVVGYLNRQSISDWIILRNYKAPAAISTLANQDGMTAYTRKVFYVNHPNLYSRSSFSNYCPNNSEQSVVLGCYHLGQNGIFLLSVNSSDLYGIEQVTAAYETLHAIYQRLSPDQQKTLNNELISFENHGLNDPIVKAQIAGFRKTEPGGVLNEMTSLFGTEVQNLPPALNIFYSKYFSNRQTLLNYYSNYQSAFTTRQQQITSADSQLSTLKSQITTNEGQLNTQLSQISYQQTTLNSEKSAGEINQYNSGVDSYNQQVDDYNSLANTTTTLISQYNQVVDDRNSVVLEEQQLVQDITAAPKSITNQ